MRLVAPAFFLVLVGTGAAIVGCDVPPDFSGQGNASDAAFTDAPVAVEGGVDSSRTDASPAEAAPVEAAADSDGANAAVDATAHDAGATSAPDAPVNAVVITADASLHATTVGGGSPCAGADSLAASPSETSVGHIIALTASGLDANNMSTDVTLTWTAAGDAGALSSTSGTATTFTCAGVGTESITVTAAVADGGASCPQTGSLSVDIKCDAP